MISKAFKATMAILAIKFRSTTPLLLSMRGRSFYNSPDLKSTALGSTSPPRETRNSMPKSPLPYILETLGISRAFSLSMNTAPFLPSSAQFRPPAARWNYLKTNILGTPREESLFFSSTALKITRDILSFKTSSAQFRHPAATWNYGSGGSNSKTNILGKPTEETLFFSQTALKIKRVILSFKSTSLLGPKPTLLLPAFCWLRKHAFDHTPDFKVAALDSNLRFHLPPDLALQEHRLPNILDIPSVSSAFSFSTTTTAFLHSSALFQHTAVCENDETGGLGTNILGNAVDDVELELGVQRRERRRMRSGGGGFEGWNGDDDGYDGQGNGDDDDDMT